MALSSYEIARNEKIARNNARLKELGLLNKPLSKPRNSSSLSSNESVQRGKKRKPPLSDLSPSLAIPVRRSIRQAGVVRNYKEWSGSLGDHSGHTFNRTKSVKQSIDVNAAKDNSAQPIDTKDIEIDDEALSKEKLEIPANVLCSKPNSTRNTFADVGATVQKLLGKELESTGKAAVIQAALEAQRNAAENDDKMISNISFNKYSGICEWQNDAIFLWVNINAPGSGVINEFLEGGKKMTWFGGSKMHEATPSIVNLIRVGRSARDGALNESDGVVLWVRIHDTTRRGFTPYTCLGRVAYESHVPGTRPLEFMFTLLDFEKLKRGKDGNSILHSTIFSKIEV